MSRTFFTQAHARMRGSSLIEVLISITILTLVMTAMIAAMATSVRSTAQARGRLIATQLAREGIEYFRTKRSQMGWQAFSRAISTGSSLQVVGACLAYIAPQGGTTTLEFPPIFSNAPCPPIGLNALFTRYADMTKVSNDVIAVRVFVQWDDNNRTSQAEVVQVFRRDFDETIPQ